MNAPTLRIHDRHLARSRRTLARGARIAGVCGLLSAALVAGAGADAAETTTPAKVDALSFRVIGDGIPDALGSVTGEAARGRALIVARESANCVLCHAVSDSAVRFSGNVGPSLDGVGSRLSVAQLRLRVADSLRLNAKTIMPSYYRVDGFDRVASAYRGRPVLDARQVEDIVAYLATLQ